MPTDIGTPVRQSSIPLSCQPSTNRLPRNGSTYTRFSDRLWRISKPQFPRSLDPSYGSVQEEVPLFPPRPPYVYAPSVQCEYTYERFPRKPRENRLVQLIW